jgi:AcrR family transcriptional regulator
MSVTPERPYHHGDLKRTLLETAQAMLREEKGWQFTLREVARRAGVSHAAPYKHFLDKAALLANLAAHGFDLLREDLASAAKRHARSVRQEFLSVAKAYVGFGVANPSLYRLMFSPDVDKTTHAELNVASQGAFGVLLEILERGQASGVFKKMQVRGQAAACWALVHGFTILQIDEQLQPDKVGLKPLDIALQCLIEGLQV